MEVDTSGEGGNNSEKGVNTFGKRSKRKEREKEGTKLRYLSEQMMLPKDNMVGDVKAMSNNIITSISFLSFAITMEETKVRTRFKFVVLMRLKKGEIGRAKGLEMLIVRGRSKKALIRSLIRNG